MNSQISSPFPCSISSDVLSDNSSVPMGTDINDLLVKEGSAGVTEAIIRPDSIVAIQSYSLRFIPFFGSAPVLLSIALRQAYYRQNRQHNNASSVVPSKPDEVNIEVASLLRMLGGVISRAKFFRIFKDGQMDWFTKRADAEHTFEDGRIKRLPNTYQFRGNLLTPGDATDLYHWLKSHLIETNPTDAVTDAIKTDRDLILQFPFRLPDSPEKMFDQAVSVRDVVLRSSNLSKLDPTLSALCDALSNHLIRPENFLSIPWYWFKKVLPELGDDMGALYLMCKSCCYVDWSAGKDRNTFWVPGGSSTLQAWIGSSTLPGRIPHQKQSQRGRPREDSVKDNSKYVRSWREDRRNLVGAYIERVATRKSEVGTDWHLRVYDTQLSKEDELLRELISSLIEDQADAIYPVVLSSILNNRTALNLLYRSALLSKDEGFCHFETLVNAGICHFDTLSGEEISHFDTLVDAFNCHFETLIAEEICHFDTVLNILLRLKNMIFLPQYTIPPHTDSQISLQSPVLDLEKQVVAGYFDNTGWKFDKLGQRINSALRTQIHARVNSVGFVSWIIYACLAPRIKHPLSFSVTRSIESGTDAGGPAARLAKLNPVDLCKQIMAAKNRLDAGYLGNTFYGASSSADLRLLLDSVESKQIQKEMLQRLIDHLGIHSEDDN